MNLIFTVPPGGVVCSRTADGRTDADNHTRGRSLQLWLSVQLLADELDPLGCQHVGLLHVLVSHLEATVRPDGLADPAAVAPRLGRGCPVDGSGVQGARERAARV